MRGASALASLSFHVVLVIGLITASASGRPVAQKPRIIELAPFPDRAGDRPSTAIAAAPVIAAAGILAPDIPAPDILLPSLSGLAGADTGGRILATTPTSGWPTAAGPLAGHLADEYPVLLAGPVPSYPELLRQARVEGRVVLEAVVDTVGRVEPGSVSIVSGHPAFGAAAARALEASLFRPARVAGRVVRIRVRVPYVFALR